MRCAVVGCKNLAEWGISWNDCKGYVPMCEECMKIYECHQKARERIGLK